jgi:hypothetical protein
MEEIEAYLDQIRDDLLAAWEIRGKMKKQLSLTLRHVLRFSTWSSLEEAGANERQKVELAMSWLQGCVAQQG